MSSQIPAQPKPGSKTGPRPGPKPGAAPGSKPRPRPAQAVAADPADPVPAAGGAPAEEEWPPREWRETTRAAGQRQALYVVIAMVVMFGVLVAVNIWGSKQG